MLRREYTQHKRSAKVIIYSSHSILLQLFLKEQLQCLEPFLKELMSNNLNGEKSHQQYGWTADIGLEGVQRSVSGDSNRVFFVPPFHKNKRAICLRPEPQL